MNQKISSIFRFYISRMNDFCKNWRWPLQLLLKKSLSRCVPKLKQGTKYWRMRIFAEKRRFICCTCPCPKFGIGFWMAIIGLLKVNSVNLRYWLGIGPLGFGQKNSELIWILKKWYFIFQCGKCNLRFPNRDKLKSHIKIHEDKKLFQST